MERKRDSRKETKGSVAVSVLIVFWFAMFFGVSCFLLWKDISAYLTYRQTTGTVLSKRIVTVKGGENDTFRPEITYSYEVDGKKYQSARYRATEVGSSAVSFSEKVLARYQVGSQCTVYYDPKDPSKAVLTVAVSAFPFVFLFFALGVLLILCTLLASRRKRRIVTDTLVKFSGNAQSASEPLPTNLWSKVIDYGTSLNFVTRPRRLNIILAGLSAACFSQLLWICVLMSEDFSFVSLSSFPLFLFVAQLVSMFYTVFTVDSEKKVLFVERHMLSFVEPEEIEFENIDRIAPEGYGQCYTNGAKYSRRVRLIIFLKDERRLKVMSTYNEYGRKLMTLLMVRLRFLVTGQAADAAQVLDEVNSAAEVAHRYGLKLPGHG